MTDNSDLEPEYDHEDSAEECNACIEQLNIVIQRGVLTGANLHLDCFEPIDMQGKEYRTHALYVDVVE